MAKNPESDSSEHGLGSDTVLAAPTPEGWRPINCSWPLSHGHRRSDSPRSSRRNERPAQGPRGQTGPQGPGPQGFCPSHR